MMKPASSISKRTLSFAALFLCGGIAIARAQQPPPPLTTAPCVPTKKEPCPAPPPPAAKKPADDFPFPGDAPAATPDAPAPSPVNGKKPGDEFPFPGDTPAPPVSNPKAAPGTPSGAAAEHPFPEDDSSSSSSSSSGSGTIPADSPELKDEGSEGTTRQARRRMPKVEDPVTREEEDLKVSKFYRDTGNFKGAYMRAQDAVKTQPADPEAHLLLAETALKLAKRDEAIAEYNAFLKLDPDPDKAKAVRRKLAEMQ